jgi:hypothetical protein
MIADRASAASKRYRFIPARSGCNSELKEEEMKSKLMMIVMLSLVSTLVLSGVAVAADMHTSSKFEGPKANTGTVSHSKKDGKNLLTFSDDFVVPDTPDPHVLVIDSKGQSFLLDKLKVKGLVGDKVKKEIVVPAYVHDIATVQIYCAWAEANLGEAKFSTPVK